MDIMKRSMNTGSNPIKDFKIIRKYCCVKCGAQVTDTEFKMPIGPEKGKLVKSKGECDCALIAKVKENQRMARERRLQRTFEENSLINPSIKDATFDNFDKTEFADEYYRAKKYVDEFDINKPKNLLFQGSFGTGKSHLSVAITKALRDKGYSTIFISTPKLLTKIRNTYNSDSRQNEQDIIDMISSVDLVVFDDIGAEGDARGWGLQKIFEVIDQRAGKHNVYTTNLSSDDFEASLDRQRIFSRMLMNTEPIIMNGTDYRRRKFVMEN